jgi:prepilin-type N-terminal cleavage/methylation domain-containing protein
MKPPLSSQSAFSLVELLVVISIFGVLAAVSVGSFSASGKAGDINVGVARVMSALMQARSEAIARNTGVQFRVVTRAPDDQAAAGRVFSLWARKKDGSQEYEPISRWERLPDGISLIGDTAWFDTVKSGDRSMEGENPLEAGGELSGVGYRGGQVSVRVVEFSPGGGIRLPKPSQAYIYLLLAGTSGSSGENLDSRADDVLQTSNWRQIRISNLTGQIRVNTPRS